MGDSQERKLRNQFSHEEGERLMWVEQRLLALITEARRDAGTMAASTNPAVRGRGIGYAVLAQALENILDQSHVPGGPQVDHAAIITRHAQAMGRELAVARTLQATRAATQPPDELLAAQLDAAAPPDRVRRAGLTLRQVWDAARQQAANSGTGRPGATP